MTASLATVVGGKTATALGKAFGIATVPDLLAHYPRRYLDRGSLTDLGALRDGEQVTVLAEIREVTSRRMKARRGTIVEAVITDGTGQLRLTFFNQHWRGGQLRAGRRGLFSGQVGSYRGQRQLAHPQCRLLPDGVDDDPELVAEFAGEVIPIYPATASMDTWKVQHAVTLALPLASDLPDPVPADVRDARGLLHHGAALAAIHRPATYDDAERARESLRFEEAFVLQAALARRRAATRALPARRRVPASTPLVEAFDAQLPFVLTAGQREVGEQIAHDLAQDHPMHRLLQGDVGSGKTVVALRAMLRVVDAGGQAALLAPTEVLAAQHYRSIRALLGPLGEAGLLGGAPTGTSVALVTGSQRTSTRRRELLDIVSGDAGIVVGTHALLEDAVEFHDLALVVVDEQHRFGVEQRAALAAKARDGSRPHVLVMTATPIPRTVAMTVFGDVDVSTLDELPSGRAPISTHVVAVREQPAHLARVWQRVREEVQAGHRVFVVCPRIGDGSDEVAADAEPGADSTEDEADEDAAAEVPLAAVIPTARELAEGPLAGVAIGVLHGGMPAAEKDDVMRRFADIAAPDGIQVVVSTTVVEVGVDVPAATVMVVLDADRFGISQLHQLRGRVGRGGLPGLALLLTSAPPDSPARERLAAVASTTDGFALAALDLEQRREGDVLGSTQSGRRSSLRLLEVARHEDVIRDARDAATRVLDADPTLDAHPALAAAIDEREQAQQADYLEKA